MPDSLLSRYLVFPDPLLDRQALVVLRRGRRHSTEGLHSHGLDRVANFGQADPEEFPPRVRHSNLAPR